MSNESRTSRRNGVGGNVGDFKRTEENIGCFPYTFFSEIWGYFSFVCQTAM